MARSKGMKVEVVDKEVTPQSANAQSVVVSRQTDGDENISTTERLFGDLVGNQDSAPAPAPEPIKQNPAVEIEKEAEPLPSEVKPEENTPDSPKQDTVPQPEAPSAGIDDLNKKVLVKIDGREEEVTMKELRDQYQIKKHLSMQSDKVGEERRKLAEERRALMELRQSQQQNVQSVAQQVPTQDFTGGYTQTVPLSNDVNILNQKIQFLEAQVNQVLEGTKPMVYQSNRQRVSDELKSQGFGDFMEYIPKMESHLGNVQNPQLANFYDTPDGAKALYFQLKAQDLKEMISVPRGTTAPEQVSSATNRPPITKIDGGSQPSNANNDDSGFNYRNSFKRATRLGDDKEAWNDVLRQKGILTD